MSFDLFFYKSKGSTTSENDIREYLTNKIKKQSSGVQWFYENPDTEVYFNFTKNEPETDTESVRLFDSFAGFENVHFSFHLNFLRPLFFGSESFPFIEQMESDLDLYALNLQSDAEVPIKESTQQMFKNWSATNLRSSELQFKELNATYLSPEKSNDAWHYNFNRQKLQEKLVEYFVPKMFFYRIKSENRAITISSWTENMPTIIPNSDYFVLVRKYKRFFKMVEDKIFVSRATILRAFAPHFEDVDIKDCKITKLTDEDKIKTIFNSLKPEGTLADLAERLPMENLYNAKSA